MNSIIYVEHCRDKNAKPEINMKVPSNHFDFGAIFPLLSNLEEVILCYKVV